MLHLDADWCFQVQQSVWAIDRFVGVEKFMIDDPPLYEQFCRTTDRLMDVKVHLEEKEQRLVDLAAAVFSVACRPQSIRSEGQADIEKLK